MKKKLIFLFPCMLLCLMLFTVGVSADVSDSVHIPEEELAGFALEDGDVLVKIYSHEGTPLPYWVSSGYSIAQILSMEGLTPRLVLLDDEGVWEPYYVPELGFRKESLSAYEYACRPLAYYAYHPDELFASAYPEVDVTVLEAYCFFSMEYADYYSYSSFIYFVTTGGDYVYYAPNRQSPQNPNGYMMPASVLGEMYAARAADYQYHREPAPGFHLSYDEAYDLSSYRVHGDESVTLHKHDPSELNPKEEPQKKDFPYGLVIGISLAVIAVGGVSIVLVKKKRSKA